MWTTSQGRIAVAPDGVDVGPCSCNVLFLVIGPSKCPAQMLSAFHQIASFLQNIPAASRMKDAINAQAIIDALDDFDHGMVERRP